MTPDASALVQPSNAAPSPVARSPANPGAPPASASRTEFLTFSPPAIGDEEIDEVVDTLRSGWVTTGPKTRQFETEFAARVGAPGAVALSSCTAALHTSLLALGIRPGDEVITSTMTFAACANVIAHVGAVPVLVDVEEDTLNLDPAWVAAAVTRRTRAILAVHYAGHPAELDALHALTEAAGLALIEDAAHAFPASYRGRPIGAGPNPVAFSFYATKNLTTGEGGMLTGAPELVERVRRLSLHGMSRDAWGRYAKGGRWYYEVLEPGWKYNMTDLQAALGLAQLRKIDAFQRRRREIVAAYDAAFRDDDALEPPTARPHVESAWHLYVLRLRLAALRIGRDRFIEELAARNIGTSVHFIPIHLHPYYRDTYRLAADAFPVALRSYQRMISLPLHPGLRDRDVADIVEAVRDVARTFRR